MRLSRSKTEGPTDEHNVTGVFELTFLHKASGQEARRHEGKGALATEPEMGEGGGLCGKDPAAKQSEIETKSAQKIYATSKYGIVPRHQQLRLF